MAGKLWQGRFKEATDKLVETFTASIRFDQRLYQYDVEGSMAHCRMLARQGLISEEEADILIQGLSEILREIERGSFVFKDTQEDVHMAIEQRLIEKVGEVGGRLHTGRSRNDQVALDIRLFLRDEIKGTDEDLRDLQQSLVDQAKKHLGVIMPGFTHLQHAQPVLFSHHLMAYYEMFRRDRQRLEACLQRVNVSPLGSAALAGTSLPIDSALTAELLDFPAVSRNSIDAVSDRDFIIEFIAAAALVMMHLSRMCEELILWSSTEFGYLEISESFCTGSSIMPQKKNPDVAELVRGKSGRVYGHLMSLLTMMKGLPLAYNRDLQEDKEPLFDTIDTVRQSLKILARLWENLSVNQERMEEMATTGYTMATDVTEYLVGRGISFRQAHQTVGKIVRYCLEQGKELQELTLQELRGFTKVISEDIIDLLDPKHSVNSRSSRGGTALEQVREAIALAEKELST
ncbi:MAG: argininosuccinate lyase [Deltaproteobacteria bacterium]|nr:MAG: argininosuccinate lyase [Deltaproteobacteria bacterium]